jgi:hypothetical protein
MTTNTLENFSLYLWRNPEGLHVTVTTNYNLPVEKRSFFSFGNQTYKSWRAFNQHQPVPLKDFFAKFKNQWQNKFKTHTGNFWISKLATNTKTHGRRTAQGAMILFEIDDQNFFIMQLKDQYFEGKFDDSNLSDKQLKGAKGVCLGSFMWRDDTGDIQEYAEAF